MDYRHVITGPLYDPAKGLRQGQITVTCRLCHRMYVIGPHLASALANAIMAGLSSVLERLCEPCMNEEAERDDEEVICLDFGQGSSYLYRARKGG